MLHHSKYFFLFVCILLCCGACSSIKELKSNESLLVKNSIKFRSKVKGRSKLKSEMATIYKQIPNSGLFKMGLWWHYRVDEPGDTTKFDRWVKKVLAEPPAIYDKSLAEATAISMKYFLQHKGYKDVIVKDSAITKRKKTKVVYLIEPNDLYVIDTVVFNCKDTVVRLILNDLREETYLEKGKPVSSELFDKEASRITEALQNRGYAYFAQNYIKPKGLPDGNKVKVIYNVLTPPETQRHQNYRIGKIFVDPYYTQQGLLTRKRDTVIVDGVHFLQGSITQIKPQNILKSIFFRPGDLYQESNFKKSNRQLGALEIIKYVSMSPRESPDSIGVLDFEILLSPKKRMTLGGDVEFNNSTYNSVNTNLLGTSFSLNFRNRNIFKNAAVFNARAEVGFELNISPNDNLLYSRNVTLQSDLYFPRFVDLLSFWKLTKKTRLLRSSFYNDLRDKAKTRLSASFENISLFDFYEYNSFNGTFGYELQRDRNNRFILNQTGINMLLVDIKQDFAPIIANNPFLQESFSDQLFTGFLFRDFSYIHTGKRNTLGVSWFFRGDFELSGAEVWLANSIRNAVASTPTTFQLFNSVDFAQYFRFEVDVRRFKQYSSGKHSWAFRFNSAIAVPYGFSTEVPYVKQYFLGGPNSLRAWRIRELGPGSYLDPNTIPPADTIPFYQAANFKIEFNLEYRRDIIKFWGTTVEGAVFLDGGNIWTLRQDTSRIGSQLLWRSQPNPSRPNETIGDNFLRQIALGSGVGIRLDFNYFILRFDMALKLRNNFRDPETNSYWVDRNWTKLQLRDFNYNLAVGYPF